MNIKKKLQNPFVLVAQGFIAGSIIFYATMPADVDARGSAPSASAPAAKEISRA
jgi:hypothetical protein